jgi:hypothetical protein
LPYAVTPTIATRILTSNTPTAKTKKEGEGVRSRRGVLLSSEHARASGGRREKALSKQLAMQNVERWRRWVVSELVSSVSAYEELDDEGGRAALRYWDPADEVDPTTEAGREECVARRFVIAKRRALRGELVICGWYCHISSSRAACHYDAGRRTNITIIKRIRTSQTSRG